MTQAQPARYAGTEAEERRDLARLKFVGAAQRAFCLDRRNPIELLRSELPRVYPADMARLDAACMGPPARTQPPRASNPAPMRRTNPPAVPTYASVDEGAERWRLASVPGPSQAERHEILNAATPLPRARALVALYEQKTQSDMLDAKMGTGAYAPGAKK